MFEDYASTVLSGYEEKRVHGTLSTNLMHPTPAKLKRECLIAFDQRFSKKDEFALSSFFEPRESKETCRLAVKKHEVDKFRPLNTVLRSGARKTDEKNIELLAWLIDHQPRPYIRWAEANTGPKNTDMIVKPPEVSGDQANGSTEPAEKTVKVKGPPYKKMAVALLVIITLTMTIYLAWPLPSQVMNSMIALISRHGKCMYWAGDHFKIGSYEELHHDTPGMPIDTVKLNYFRKITDWNTLGENAVGKVWYAKIRGQLEIFTMPGFHPVDTNRSLLPLSEYMLRKYIRPGPELVNVMNQYFTVHSSGNMLVNTNSNTRNIIEVQLPAKSIGYVYRVTTTEKAFDSAEHRLSDLLRGVASEKLVFEAELAEFTIDHADSGAIDVFAFNNDADANHFLLKQDTDWQSCWQHLGVISTCAATQKCLAANLYFGFRNNNIATPVNVHLEVVALVDSTVN